MISFDTGNNFMTVEDMMIGNGTNKQVYNLNNYKLVTFDRNGKQEIFVQYRDYYFQIVIKDNNQNVTVNKVSFLGQERQDNYMYKKDWVLLKLVVNDKYLLILVDNGKNIYIDSVKEIKQNNLYQPQLTTAPIITATLVPTAAPTTAPTAISTMVPTGAPTTAPTVVSTTTPTVVSTTAPTTTPAMALTVAPTTAPTAISTMVPTGAPTTAPTLIPTTAPTVVPTTNIAVPNIPSSNVLYNQDNGNESESSTWVISGIIAVIIGIAFYFIWKKRSNVEKVITKFLTRSKKSKTSSTNITSENSTTSYTSTPTKTSPEYV